ncbi:MULTISPECIES: very short patch repair endonuclease [unclassified Adlercreutzia]|uniref:very short patch repair endonuclease n=1 Tax=unclassified Adlercreutzia TaxID=2636013 RepID=UPI001F153949|nr:MULTISPECIES: very short patch repair endonuclease [unclassified Adlercreutzia]
MRKPEVEEGALAQPPAAASAADDVLRQAPAATSAADDVLRQAPAATSAAVRKCMQGNKRRDTTPELKVRAMLRELGYPGYRLDWKKAPGHPDIAYPGRKIAIFVMGCFWHRCPVCDLPQPKSNVAYWQAKFDRNVERDARTRHALEEAGWKVVYVWEHELKKDQLEATRRKLHEAVRRETDPPHADRLPARV